MSPAVAYILFGLIVPIFAVLEIFDGRCPIDQVQYVKNFNQSAFEGAWYALYAYEETEYVDCADHIYKWHPVERLFSISTRRRNLSTGSTDLILWFAEEQKADSNNGKFYQWEYYNRNGKTENPPSKYNSTHQYILNTDYENFAVVWSCEEYGLINEQNLLVFTKGNLPLKALDDILRTILTPPLDIRKLKYHELEDERCYKSRRNRQLESAY